ncbi:hypothetical protein PBN151_2638 [Paenibacillus sp. NAIST15-1]|nr:hypothetical protein PBN151_2638 [Paenibacillus sp. NAIST15-1]
MKMITNRMLKKSLSALLSIVLLLSLVQPQVIRAASGQGNTQLNNMIEQTVQYYKDYYKDVSNQDAVSDSWWELVALWSAGQDLHDGTWRLPTWETKEPRLRPNAGGTDHIRYIYGLLALGKNPAHAWETNRNLWAELAAQQDPTTGAIGGVNKHIWAMLALNAGEKLGQDMGSWNASSKQKALDYLLKAQYADGGYGLSATGSSGDTDITGMALLALGQYQGQSAVDAAIERAKELLKKRQLDNGGFDSVGTWGSGDNSNSLSTSVSGLVAAGDDVLSAKWRKSGNTVIDAYARFQQNNGSFKWKVTDNATNRMSTEQALVALLDIKHGKSAWNRLAEVKLPPDQSQTNGRTVLVGEHQTSVTEGTYLDPLSSSKVTLEFLKDELPHVISVTSSTYLEIAPKTVVISTWDKRLELPHSLGISNDNLLTKVNEGLSLVNKETTGIDLRLKVGGDQEIRFNQHVTLILKGQGDKEAGFINENGIFTSIPKYDNSSERNEEVYSYALNGDLIVKTNHFTEFVTYISKIKETGNGNGGGVVPPVTNTITLSVEKRTIGKGDIIAPVRVELQDGDTAYTALERIAEKRGISIESTGSGANLYIQAIDGLAEFDNGSLSGWMYSVNGKFPNYSAGIYNLKNGDVLRWQYTTNLGEDVGNKFEGNKETPGKPGLPVHPGGAGTGGGALTPKQVEESAKLKSLIDGASAWILSNRKFTVQDNFNDWDVMALARSGKKVPSTYYAILENYVKEKKGEFRLVTDYERMALAVTAIGKDPSNVAGFNLLEKIYNNGRMTNQGTNGLVFALLALDANKTVVPNDALWTRDKLIQQLLAQQNSDGGFPLSKESNAVSDIDMTAMSLQALAKYQDRKEVKAATDKALSWLSSQQLANGGFKAWGVETSESISQVIIALSGLGIDLEDKRFVKKDGDLLKALRTYFNTDGGFAHSRGEASNYMATQQALLALTAYDRVLTNRTSLYVMTDAASTGTQKPKDEKITYTDDASISAWAKEAVHKATELGFMQGTGKDKDASQFEPKRELSRAEFAALIVKFAGLQPQGTDSGFTDVSASSWYAGYVATAKEKGLISGVSANKFAPNQAISRQEMAAMLIRMKGLPKDADSSAGPKDQQQVAEWALPYVKYAYQAGLMSGEDGYFKPQLHVTREMAAVVMVRLHGIQ